MLPSPSPWSSPPSRPSPRASFSETSRKFLARAWRSRATGRYSGSKSSAGRRPSPGPGLRRGPTQRVERGQERPGRLARILGEQHADGALAAFGAGDQLLGRAQEAVETPQRFGLLVDEDVEPPLALLHLVGDAPSRLGRRPDIVEGAALVEPLRGAAKGRHQPVDGLGGGRALR